MFIYIYIYLFFTTRSFMFSVDQINDHQVTFIIYLTNVKHETSSRKKYFHLLAYIYSSVYTFIHIFIYSLSTLFIYIYIYIYIFVYIHIYLYIYYIYVYKWNEMEWAMYTDLPVNVIARLRHPISTLCITKYQIKVLKQGIKFSSRVIFRFLVCVYVCVSVISTC